MVSNPLSDDQEIKYQFEYVMVLLLVFTIDQSIQDFIDIVNIWECLW